jgi:hypothetical protein
MMGEVIKKEKAIPKGTPESKKFKNILFDDFGEKGVIAPKIDAVICPSIPFFIIKYIHYIKHAFSFYR